MSDVVEILRQLVSISSVSCESNRPLVSFAGGLLANAGWSSQEHAYFDSSGTEKVNLIAWPAALPPDNKTVELALVCHTDTIPYAASWTEATTPIVAGENLKGCGACDVKGFLACILAVVGRIDARQLKKPLAIVLTADEEVGCVGVRQLLEQQALRAKFAIVGEPTSLRPVRAGKGYCLAEVNVLGSEAHSALPENGKSAIYRAARLIVEIEKISENLKTLRAEDFSPPHTTLNIGEIHGGLAKNIVPPSCRFLLEWRPIPDQPADLVAGLVRKAIGQLAGADPSFQCDFQVLRTQEGFSVAEGSRLLRALSAASGNPPGSVAFGTEAPWLMKMGAEAVVFGPGAMSSAHSPREFVPMPELFDCVEILRHVIGELCGSSKSGIGGMGNHN